MDKQQRNNAVQPKKATYTDMEAIMVDKLTEPAPNEEIIAVRQKNEQENPIR